MDLARLLADPGVTIADVGDALDRASHAEQCDAVFALDRAGQRRLYQAAHAAPGVHLDDFVPANRAPREAVRHHGRNTLPVLPTFRRFEKRFCRPADGSARLFGYNEGPTRSLIGPGCFVAIETRDEAPPWQERGGVVVDYYRVPDGEVAPGWPPVVPNSRGLQFFVYNKTRDFMRRVSQHVTIGAAFKQEKALDHYFVLVRER